MLINMSAALDTFGTSAKPFSIPFDVSNSMIRRVLAAIEFGNAAVSLAVAASRLTLSRWDVMAASSRMYSETKAVVRLGSAATAVPATAASEIIRAVNPHAARARKLTTIFSVRALIASAG